MASMFGCAYQVTNTVVEMLFVLDHRLRDHAKKRRALNRVCDDGRRSKNRLACAPARWRRNQVR